MGARGWKKNFKNVSNYFSSRYEKAPTQTKSKHFATFFIDLHRNKYRMTLLGYFEIYKKKSLKLFWVVWFQNAERSLAPFVFFSKTHFMNNMYTCHNLPVANKKFPVTFSWSVWAQQSQNLISYFFFVFGLIQKI